MRRLHPYHALYRSGMLLLSAYSMGIVGCTSMQSGAVSREHGAVGTREQYESALLDALGRELARDAGHAQIVVRGALLSMSALDAGVPVTGTLGQIDPAALRVSAAAGGLVDAWAGPGSPWELRFATVADSSVAVIVSLFEPAVLEHSATISVYRRTLRANAPHQSDGEVWSYAFRRDGLGTPWRFHGRTLQRAY